jgi:hypothetical protein
MEAPGGLRVKCVHRTQVGAAAGARKGPAPGMM